MPIIQTLPHWDPVYMEPLQVVVIFLPVLVYVFVYAWAREREREKERERSVCVASCSPVLHSVHCSPFTCIINASLTKRGVLRRKWPISPYCTLSQAHITGGCSTHIRRIFVDFISSNLKHAHTTRFEYRGTSHTTRYYLHTYFVLLKTVSFRSYPTVITLTEL